MECSLAARECDFLTQQAEREGLSPKDIVDSCIEMAGELVPGVSVVRCPAKLLMGSISRATTSELPSISQEIEDAS